MIKLWKKRLKKKSRVILNCSFKANDDTFLRLHEQIFVSYE